VTIFPPLPDGLEPTDEKVWDKALWDAKLKRVEAMKTAEDAIDAEFFKAIFAVAQGSVDRARAGAETVQKAAAAIAGLYTPFLAVVFSIKEHPLPSRGIIPVLFLGIAIVSSSAYLAYLTRARPVTVLTPGATPRLRNIERARSFIKWTRAAAEHRSYLLRLSVVALATGLAFLPAAFVSVKSPGDASTGATTTTSPDWPAPSANAGDVPALQKVVYAAQVAEIAEARKLSQQATPIDTGENDDWWRWALIAALFMLIAPLLIEYFFGGSQTED
jgi:hypothetical protein